MTSRMSIYISSSVKGVLLYELHLPMFMGAKMDYDNGEIQAPQAKIQFEESLKCLNQAIELLKYEQNGTLENTIHHGAIMQAQQLEHFVKITV